jgi:hypothetical protein
MTNSIAVTSARAIGVDFAKHDMAGDKIIQRVTALFTGVDYTAWGDHFEVILAGYMATRPTIAEESGRKAINRLIERAGLTKPKAQNAEAAAKAAKREAEKKRREAMTADDRAAEDRAAVIGAAQKIEAKADKLLADAAKAKADGQTATAKRLEAAASLEAAKAEEKRAEAENVGKAEAAKAEAAKFKAAATIVGDAMKADASVARVLAWAVNNLDAVVALMAAEQAKSLASAGKIKPTPLAAKPVPRSRKAAGVGM